jgi:hypothetical protein
VTKESFYIQYKIERSRITQNGIGGILYLRGLFINNRKWRFSPLATSTRFLPGGEEGRKGFVARFIPLDSPTRGLSIDV